MSASTYITAAMIRAVHEWYCLQAGPLRTLHEMHVAQ
jgi:hypothetical protein